MSPRYWLAVAVVVAAAAAGYFLFFKTTPVANYPSAGTDIIAFGDSLVAGEGATEGHDFVALLAQAAGRSVINLGVPGNTSAQGLSRVGELDKYKPKVVLLLLGGNDYLRRVPQEQTFANLGKIIENIQGRGAIVLLLGVRGGVFGDHFNAGFQKLAKTYNTAYVSNVLDGLLGDPKYMSDQIHPNDAGYAIIANRINPILKPLLQ